MASERHIYATARRFIDRFGDAAATAAAMRADEYCAEHELGPAHVWVRIVKAINELQRGRTPDEAVN